MSTNNSGTVRHWLTLRALQDQFSRGHANYWRVPVDETAGIPKSVTGRRENGAVGNNFWIRSDAPTKEKRWTQQRGSCISSDRISRSQNNSPIIKRNKKRKITATKTNVEVINSRGRRKQLTWGEEHLPSLFHLYFTFLRITSHLQHECE